MQGCPLETILSNFRDPSWWVTAFFPVLVLWLTPKVFRRLGGIWGAVRVTRIRRIKGLRWDDLKISFEMQKSSAFYVVFVLLGVFWLLALVVVPVKLTSSELVFASSTPVLISEFAWLLQDSFVRDLLKARDRILHATGDRSRRFRFVADKLGGR